eukprot:11326138-Prorocentrum_lima.AAC.1
MVGRVGCDRPTGLWKCFLMGCHCKTFGLSVHHVLDCKTLHATSGTQTRGGVTSQLMSTAWASTTAKLRR